MNAISINEQNVLLVQWNCSVLWSSILSISMAGSNQYLRFFAYNYYFGWLCPCMPSHIQTCLNLSWDNFVCSGSSMATLNLIQSEKLIEF